MSKGNPMGFWGEFLCGIAIIAIGAAVIAAVAIAFSYHGGFGLH